jgi:UDPglucose 6-dehydrogenase
VVEPGLREVLHEHRRSIEYSADPRALSRCDVAFLATDVPTGDSGESDLVPVNELMGTVRPHLARDATLVVLCQVPPGYTRGLDWPAPRRYYQVETLIFGQAVERAMNPERIIVGCSDPTAPLPDAYREFLSAFGCPILPMRYESAELAKIAINCFLASSITTTNTLAELCEKIGADWAEIVPALRLDKRIGPHAYLSPGLGIAGGNLERDLSTVRRIAQEHGTDAKIVSAWLRNSRHRRDWALRVLHRELLAEADDPVIAVLGLAYKADTDSTKNSASLDLIRHLAPWRVRVHDPAARPTLTGCPHLEQCTSPLEAIGGADAVAVMTPWSAYREITAFELRRLMRGRLVLDPYRILNGAELRAAGFEYRCLGTSPIASSGGRGDA